MTDFTVENMNIIKKILESGHVVELKIEHGQIVILEIRRRVKAKAV